VTATAALPTPPAAALEVFGERLALAVAFGQQLASDATVRGLIGPREVPRLWDRHLLNCAVVTELLPPDAQVVDVGSGAGLPGIAMACRRGDLRVDLVESLTRRVAFLKEVVDALGLDEMVRIVHGRAEDPKVRAAVGGSGWVTARAVAPLDRLVRWCVPLLRPGGTLLAIKGEQADVEVEGARQSKGVDVSVVQCGVGTLDTPVTVVAVRRLRA
jgi:16S rRNA (guanine527-N7)-methyltransferase